MKRRYIFLTMALLLLGTAAYAVLNEKDLSQTLNVLRYELSQENAKLTQSRKLIHNSNERQHTNMVDMFKKSNELSLMLYSQNQDYTFDLTYSLKEVTKSYETFNENKMPYDDILERIDIDIERYQRLIESLRQLPPALDKIEEVPDSISVPNDSLMSLMPPVKHSPMGGIARPDSVSKPFMLDEQGLEDRDSCLYYARNLLKMYINQKERIERDSEHYDETSNRLKKGYDYAQKRYRELQKNIFIKGQDNYFKIISKFRSYSSRAFSEAKAKYSRTSVAMGDFAQSEWRGPKVTGFIVYAMGLLLIAVLLSAGLVALLSSSFRQLRTDSFRRKRKAWTLLIAVAVFSVAVMVMNCFIRQNFIVEASRLLLRFSWLVIVIMISLMIHHDSENLKVGLRLYMPLILMGLVVITFRAIFIPNRLINLIFPPLMLAFCIWQAVACKRTKSQLPGLDRVLGWLTLLVFAVTTVLSWAGFVLMSVQILIWWLFQMAAIQTVSALADIVKYYEKSRLKVTIKRENRGEHITATWLFDLFSMAVLPIAGVLSVPLCIFLASEVFDLTAICNTVFYKPFFDVADASGNVILHLSLYKLVVATALFFLFRYLVYAGKAFYKHFKFISVKRQSGQQHVRANQVNLTLANNIISISLWGLYIIIVITLFKIPMGAISIVAAGLATGIGLALKDVLNNFIYGIQLMSGRVRVGDLIECDGVRGKVESISYQSTQIITLEGVVMSITNSNLFNKSFKNLTRNSPYEFVKIVVGVAYGTDVRAACELISTALSAIDDVDKYGRRIVEPEYGVKAMFGDFGDSSVDLAVKQYVIVEEEAGYIARAKSLIYDTLNANGIEIPFPQRDLHIIR